MTVFAQRVRVPVRFFFFFLTKISLTVLSPVTQDTCTFEAGLRCVFFSVQKTLPFGFLCVSMNLMQRWPRL